MPKIVVVKCDELEVKELIENWIRRNIGRRSFDDCDILPIPGGGDADSRDLLRKIQARGSPLEVDWIMLFGHQNCRHSSGKRNICRLLADLKTLLHYPKVEAFWVDCGKVNPIPT
jgi:hypothetical protein